MELAESIAIQIAEKETIKVTGLDLSLNGTGVCNNYFPKSPEGKEPYIETRRLTHDLTGPERLIYVRDKVIGLFQGTELACLENYAFARTNQAHQVGELGGVIRVALYEAGIEYVLVTPNQLKKFATGKGGGKDGGKKEDVKLGVYKHWGKEFPSNDEADAFVLAKIGEALIVGMGEDLEKYKEKGYTVPQIEILAELRGEKIIKSKSPKKAKEPKETKVSQKGKSESQKGNGKKGADK